MSVTLQTATFFSAFGVACWILGYWIEQPIIAMLGGLFVTALGLMIVNGALVEPAGTVETVNTTTNTTTISTQYEQVQPPDQFPLGWLVFLTGATGMLLSLNQYTE